MHEKPLNCTLENNLLLLLSSRVSLPSKVSGFVRKKKETERKREKKMAKTCNFHVIQFSSVQLLSRV